jgi:hypothetical protein
MYKSAKLYMALIYPTGRASKGEAAHQGDRRLRDTAQGHTKMSLVNSMTAANRG